MKIFIFVGTTAELIKLVPVIREFQSRKVKFTIIATGQNDIHFEEFPFLNPNPRIIYAVTPKGKESSLILFILWAIRTFFSLLIGLHGYLAGSRGTNALVIVHGDTVSSLLGALVATWYKVRLAHIESGLRSFNFLEPFPEELCRFIVSKVADIHFCPNKWAVQNLSSFKGAKINTGQNTLIEAFWPALITPSVHPLVRQLARDKTKYFVLVVHRQEHVMFAKKPVANTVSYILQTIPKSLRCIFLVHDVSVGFMRTLGSILPLEVSESIVHAERLPYSDFMHLLWGAKFMITDGGSNQEELYYMGKPCLLLRGVTERREGLGENVVLSKNNHARILNFLHHYRRYARKPVKIRERPSKIIVDYLFRHDV